MDTSAFTPEIVDRGGKPLYKFYSGVSWEESANGEVIEIYTPSTREILGYAPAVTREQIDRVLETQRIKQPSWEETPLSKRIDILKKSAQLLRSYEGFFTSLLVDEIGKTKAEAKSEVLRSADLIEYYTQEVVGLVGEYRDSDAFPGFPKGRLACIERVAHGVVLSIAPFNYPINLAVSKIAPALLMGNAVICKPPTQGSLVGLAMTKVFVEAGVPEGIIACVTGKGSQIGDYLVSHRDISMIAFTGSSETGAHIAKTASMIPLLFECGGNNPVLVCDDADMDAAAKEIVKGAFSYSGQRCTGIKYVLASEDVLGKLIPAVSQTMDSMVAMGDPHDEGTKLVGPLIDPLVADDIGRAITEAAAGGATIVRGGEVSGAYVTPTLLSHVKPEMRVVATEIFGPVVSFIGVSSPQEAISIMNNSRYGLQASIFTKDEGRGMALAKAIHTGTVQINGSPQRGPDHFPFMGIKQSGLGVQGIRYSLEAMGRIRSTVINFPG